MTGREPAKTFSLATVEGGEPSPLLASLEVDIGGSEGLPTQPDEIRTRFRLALALSEMRQTVPLPEFARAHLRKLVRDCGAH